MKSWSVVAIGAALAASIGLAPSASMAATPDVYCANADRTPGAGDPAASEVLARTTATIESGLSQLDDTGGDADDLRSAAEVTLPANAAPSAAALAAYCAAAGEIERVGRSGNASRARAFLTAAMQYALVARNSAAEAQAAYRIGELSSSVVVAINSRGPSSRAAKAATEAATLVDADMMATPKVDACDALSGLGADALNSSRSPTLALQCAAAQAAAAGDQRLASLADLRLARLRLVAAAKSARQSALLRDLVYAPGDGEGGARSARSAARGGAGEEPALAGSENILPSPALRELAAVAALSGLRSVEGAPDPAGRVQIAGRLVEAVMDAGQASDPVLPRAIEAMRTAAPGDPGAQAWADALSGRIALEQGDVARAKAFLQRAIFLESQRARPTRLADWYLLMARAAPDERARYADAAYLALENVRPFLPLRDPLTEEPTFELHMRAVFETAADSQLSQAGGMETSGAIARVQQIVEASREAEIQSNFGSECIPPTPPIQPAALRDGEIILYPILLEDRVELLYVAGGAHAAFHRLAPNTAFNRERVAALVEGLRTHLMIPNDSHWVGPSHQLYDLLIAPIESRLDRNTTLVVMPDGPLRALPFAALMDGQDRFLIERTRLSLAPALSYAQPGLDRAGPGASVVAAALEREVDLPQGRFLELAGTGDEARAAAGGRTRGPQNILLENFTRASLMNALARSRPNVLHLATHAAFNGRSDRSYIVADGEVIPMAELRGMIGQSQARGDALDLLVLSACETAVGDDQASMGLAGAAVQAGARSAIASVWPADDAATTTLMEAFYGAYRGGATKAEALRTAQLAVLNQGLRDPYYWAAFTLIGGWR